MNKFGVGYADEFIKRSLNMSDSPLITKSKEFALEIITVCNTVKQIKKETVLTNQLIRSGTSIEANIREAFYAHSKPIFFLNYIYL